ncbi:hypothetical protein KCU95_g15627, partial [Aureobasidium melanogenum]
MCCKRGAARQALTVAKLNQDQPIMTSRAAHHEPLDPPPAYEQVEKESKDITSSKEIDASNFLDNQGPSNVRAVPVYSSNNANLDASSSNTTMYAPKSTCHTRRAAKHERKQQKRERRQEHRLEKREYHQEKRELRAEHRFERKGIRRAHDGPISMLIKGVSNLMKQDGKI